MFARLWTYLLPLMPQHVLSRLIGACARVRVRWFKNTLIRAFVRAYRPDLSDALERDPLAYPSFNAFFTRALAPGVRPIEPHPATVVAPVDGTVSAIGTLTGDRVLQAKGRDYSLAELLAGNRAWTERFANGQFATIYLAPYNYHRIHMPCDGELREAWFVPGRLFSVNRVAIGRIANVFTRNERVICLFDGTHGPFGLVLVGALNVGSIETVWHGGIAPRRGRCAQRLPSAPLRAPALLHKGAELGRFNLGSTVIVLFPPRRCRWRAGLQPGSALRMGAAIGDLDMQS